MQTFVPYADLEAIPKTLDQKRLGKQRVEAWQILNTLECLQNGNLHIKDKNGVLRKRGWVSHPAVLMWKGHEWFLCLYAEAVCKEWISRGYKDTMLPRFEAWRLININTDKSPPTWWGKDAIHRSHRSKLLEKDYSHYKHHFTDVEAGLEYVWG